MQVCIAGTRNGVRLPAQKRYCKHEAVPKRRRQGCCCVGLFGIGEKPATVESHGKAGNGRRRDDLPNASQDIRTSGYLIRLSRSDVHENVCTRFLSYRKSLVLFVFASDRKEASSDGLKSRHKKRHIKYGDIR